MISLTGGLLGLTIGAVLGLTAGAGADVRPRHGHTSCHVCGRFARIVLRFTSPSPPLGWKETFLQMTDHPRHS